MQKGVKITEVWYIMWFFTSTPIWYHTNIKGYTTHTLTDTPIQICINTTCYLLTSISALMSTWMVFPKISKFGVKGFATGTEFCLFIDSKNDTSRGSFDMVCFTTVAIDWTMFMAEFNWNSSFWDPWIIWRMKQFLSSNGKQEWVNKCPIFLFLLIYHLQYRRERWEHQSLDQFLEQKSFFT